MAAYSTAQMEESLAEEEVVPQAAPKSWRRFGMVVAALGSAGAIFGMTRPKSLTTLQKMQQVAHVSHSLMQAVVAKALQDEAEGITADAGIIFAPVTLDEFEGVSAQVHLRPAEAKGADPKMSVTFQAKDGEGALLKEQFQNILDGAKETMKEGPYAQMVDMLKGVEVEFPCTENDDNSTENDDNKVRIHFSPPAPPNLGKKDEKKLEEGMAAKPTLQLAIHTGKDFQEMVDTIHECPVTILGGVNITASTKLAKALVEAMTDMGTELDDGNHLSGSEAERDVHILQAFSSFSSHSEVRYNTEKLVASACKGHEGKEQKEQIEQMKAALPHMLAPVIGEETVKTLAGLKDHVSHLHSIRLAGGLPEDYEIYMEFENFHLTPVIAEFLQLPDAAPDASS